MRQIKNPSQGLVRVFGILTAVSLVAALVGFLMGGDNGFVVGLLGAIFGGVFLLVVPMAWYMGKKQVAQIQALLGGEGLLAHWTFDADEWERYTANELARGMKQTRSYSLWTFIISAGGLGVIALFAGALTGPIILVLLLLSLGLTALVGGSLYLSTQSNYAANSKGPGDLYIGGTAAYFGDRFYSWKGPWAKLEKVSFQPGDPSVIEFVYRVGNGDQQQTQEARVPVPRGREAEAQEVVNRFYAPH